MKAVYTFSSIKNMPTDIIRSIRSLSNFIEPENIIVYYTPPRDNKHLQELHNLGIDVRCKPHRAEKFSMGKTDYPSHYSDKTWLCEVEGNPVIFLDCDTIILDDPRELIPKNSDFKARPGSYSMDDAGWRAMFEEFSETKVDWMPNAGFMIFCNNVNQKIEDDWMKYLKSDFSTLDSDVNHLEQYALSLAISDFKLEKMEPNEHVFEWENEVLHDGFVYHLGGRDYLRPRQKFLNLIRMKIPF